MRKGARAGAQSALPRRRAASGETWNTPSKHTPAPIPTPTPQAPRLRCLVRKGTWEAQPRYTNAPPTTLGHGQAWSVQTLTFILLGPSRSPRLAAPIAPPGDVRCTGTGPAADRTRHGHLTRGSPSGLTTTCQEQPEESRANLMPPRDLSQNRTRGVGTASGCCGSLRPGRAVGGRATSRVEAKDPCRGRGQERGLG